jgi:hypothetical protein
VACLTRRSGERSDPRPDPRGRKFGGGQECSPRSRKIQSSLTTAGTQCAQPSPRRTEVTVHVPFRTEGARTLPRQAAQHLARGTPSSLTAALAPHGRSGPGCNGQQEQRRQPGACRFARPSRSAARPSIVAHTTRIPGTEQTDDLDGRREAGHGLVYLSALAARIGTRQMPFEEDRTRWPTRRGT